MSAVTRLDNGGAGSEPAVTAFGPSPVQEGRSLMLIRVFADRIEISEQLSQDRTEALLAELRRLGVHGKVAFNTPCG